MNKDDIIDKFKDLGKTEDELNHELQKKDSEQQRETDRKLGEMARKYRKYRRYGDTIESGPMRKAEHDVERIIGLSLGIPAIIVIIGITIWFLFY